jgi:hypothetical protein
MANAYKIKLGMMIDYLDAGLRWRSVKVVGIVSQTSLNLSYVNQNGTRTPISAGAAIPKQTTRNPPRTTNVWRPY